MVRLGKRYAIMTPYTSFLVVEDSMRPELAHRMRRAAQRFEKGKEGAGAVATSRGLGAAKNAATPPMRAPRPAAPAAGPGTPGGATGGGTFAGQQGQQQAGAPVLGLDPEAEEALQEAAAKTVVQIADKSFYRKADGVLYDSLYDEAKHKDKIVEIAAFSKEYFELLGKHKGIGRYLAKGQPMVLVVDGNVYKITKAG